MTDGSTLISQNDTSNTWLEVELGPDANFSITVRSWNNENILSKHSQPLAFETPSKSTLAFLFNTIMCKYKHGSQMARNDERVFYQIFNES